MTIDNLDPKCVWKNFYALTQIPRPSKKEWRAVDFMENFGKSLGLETIRDEVGNIIIRKPATPGMENRKGVILQGHLDMVPQNNNDVQHDWENDPVETYIDGEWVKAKGTTLGADNGLGCAVAMAVLESKDLVHGPVEALFTIDEETGMTGAQALKGGILEGDILNSTYSVPEGFELIGTYEEKGKTVIAIGTTKEGGDVIPSGKPIVTVMAADTPELKYGEKDTTMQLATPDGIETVSFESSDSTGKTGTHASGGSSGCNTGTAAIALLAFAPLIIHKSRNRRNDKQ